MIQLDSLNKIELKELLKKLKTLELLKKSLGKRGIEKFKNIIDGKTSLLVEHSSDLDSDFAFSKALEIFTKKFNLNPKIEEVKITENKSIKSGIRVFVGDQMLDLTLNRIEKILV
ncbi:MAG: hypothetical protein PHG82_02715 [Candidatus Gracilibacteria bacterium]|nr:hypothetical protein [Candidatus Gracilibacteria bacterium]